MPLRFRKEVQALPRAARLTSKPVQQVKAIDRTAVRVAYRPDENEVALERIREARLAPTVAEQATSLARALVNGVRARKPSGIDAFLHTYDLGSD